MRTTTGTFCHETCCVFLQFQHDRLQHFLTGPEQKMLQHYLQHFHSRGNLLQLKTSCGLFQSLTRVADMPLLLPQDIQL